MQIDHALDLKNTLITRNYSALGISSAARTESLTADQVVPSELSVGFSLNKPDDYHVEIRVKRKRGNAYNAAMEWKRKSENEIHVGVLQPVRVPFRDEAADDGAGRYEDFCQPRKQTLHLGLSVSYLDGTAGSLGGFVETNDNQQAVLSNAHVFGSEDNDDLFHPGKRDAPLGLAGKDAIAKLANWTTFSIKGSNYLDGAVGVLLEKYHNHFGNVIPQGFPGGGRTLRAPTVPGHIVAAKGLNAFKDFWRELNLTKDLVVAKLGRSTGYTTGYVNAFAVDDVIIEMDGVGNRRFDNLLEIRWKSLDEPFARAGDSGSLVFVEGQHDAIAIHFAGGVLDIDGKRMGISYACSLPHLLSLFNLTFL
jgi:hypothetical protein